MGFSGGGSNVLKPHTHDSTVVQDGGNLDFKNVTQSDMSAGSVTYSDGVHLQELGIGAAGNQLLVNGAGNAPVWGSEHTQGKLQVIDSYQAAVAEATHTFTFSPALNLADTYSELIIVGNLFGSATLGLGEITVNGATATYNNSGGFTWNGVTMTQILDSTGNSIILFPSSTNVSTSGVLFNCHLQFMLTGGGGVTCYACHTNTVSDGGIHAGRTSAIMDGTNSNNLANTLSTLRIFTGGNWAVNTTITVYGVLRE